MWIPQLVNRSGGCYNYGNGETENSFRVSDDGIRKREEKMDNREIILNATLEIFREKGMRFTMDDIASRVGMSKKTIYVLFQDKEDLFAKMVDYSFDQIKESEQQVLRDEKSDTVEKIRAILGVLPKSYRDLDFGQLYILKDKYPRIYERLEERLESGWETTIGLLEQGMKEGVIRKLNLPVFKTIFEATLEQFFQRDILMRSKISYQQALNEVVSILIDGIAVSK